MTDQREVLIHTCCAICSGQPIKQLQELGYKPIAYFYNPNIYPQAEYDKRLEAQRILCKSLNCELIVEEYNPNIYAEIMQGYEDYEEGSERCKRCFELRLLKTVQKADSLGIKNYTTSISISPHKKFETILNIGKMFENYFDVTFLDIDFKKQDGFMKTNLIAKTLGLYRQNYCGCEVSTKTGGKILQQSTEIER